MFKITIICVGKLKEPGYRQLETEFLKRLSPFAKVKVVEIPEVGYKTQSRREKAKLEEATAILSRLPKDSVVVLLEELGKLRSSVDFAQFVDRLGGIGRELVFVIAGGLGAHDTLRSRANHIVSLSPLTFPHNMARILLLEQLYRAGTILQKKDYHH